MKFNEINIIIGPNEVKKYAVPVLSHGDEIKLLYNDEDTKIPGCKQMKKGIFKVLKVRESYVTKGLVYELQKKRSQICIRHSYLRNRYDD